VSLSIAAIHPERPYVVHWWRNESRGDGGFYVDAARSVDIRSDTVSYVDLYLDLSNDRGGDWKLLDDEELTAASEHDARLARDAIAEVRQLIGAGNSLFDETSEMWSVPDDAMSLRPLAVERLD